VKGNPWTNREKNTGEIAGAACLNLILLYRKVDEGSTGTKIWRTRVIPWQHAEPKDFPAALRVTLMYRSKDEEVERVQSWLSRQGSQTAISVSLPIFT
jgi:hypothetical protein